MQPRMPQPFISCVVCAFNEDKTIGATLAALQDIPYIAEVIVVDDGSTDATAAIVRSHPTYRLISLPENRGKSYALAQGMGAARQSHIMILDADLIGLTTRDIEDLIAPIRNGHAHIAISLRKNSLLFYRLIGLDFVSGERIFPRSLIENHLHTIAQLPRFGFEVYLNRFIITQQLSIAVVSWQRVFNNRKINKVGWWRGIRAECGMIRDALRVISPGETLMQHYRLLRLTKK